MCKSLDQSHFPPRLHSPCKTTFIVNKMDFLIVFIIATYHFFLQKKYIYTMWYIMEILLISSTFQDIFGIIKIYFLNQSKLSTAFIRSFLWLFKNIQDKIAYFNEFREIFKNAILSEFQLLLCGWVLPLSLSLVSSYEKSINMERILFFCVGRLAYLARIIWHLLALQRSFNREWFHSSKVNGFIANVAFE